ncbi:MAG: hypothetical protein Q9184_007111 [Pyrenodesmia sp. 2 TL-2023]
MKASSSRGLLLVFPLLGLSSAACNSDNCLRALRATPTKASSFCATYTKVSNTATAIPNYGSFCSNSPSRVSSACSCVVTGTPTPSCAPSPVINGSNYGNGNFENYSPPEEAAINIQPPWYFNNLYSENAYGTYVTERKSAEFGGTVASDGRCLLHLTSERDRIFRLIGQEPNVLPGAFLRLQQPIYYCNGTTYAFSLYARRLSPNNQDCRLSIFTDYEGTIAAFEDSAFSDQFQKLGPVTRKPYRDNGVINDKGEYEDLLTILVQCTGITGQPVGDTIIQVDSVRMEPVA